MSFSLDRQVPPRNRMTTGGLLRVLLLVVLFAPSPASAQAGGANSNVPLLRPGDAVRIQVWGRPEMSGEMMVSADGYLIHPLYRTIRVDVLTLDEVEQQLRNTLSRYESNPNFVIEPLFRVAVGGAVRQPGMKVLPPGTTVRQAVLEAGGATEFGVLNRARLLRGGTISTVDFSTVAGAQTTVASGDEIVVDRRRSVLRDVIVPVSSVVGAITSVAHIIWRIRG